MNAKRSPNSVRNGVRRSTLCCAHRDKKLSAIDITPAAITAIESKRLLAKFVTDLSIAGPDLAEVKSRRIRARRRLLANAEKLRTKDKLGLIASASVIADLIDQGWLIKINRKSRILAHRPSDDDEEVRVHKRRRYHAARDAQLRQPATREFI